jgi:hypothetical protein
MTKGSDATCFAPPERLSESALLKEAALLECYLKAQHLIQCIPQPTAILAPTRQILWANTAFLAHFGIKNLHEIIGLRPGELIRCNHLPTCPNGCGTGAACQVCEAVNAVLESQHNRACRKVTHRVNQSGKVLDFAVHALPIHLEDRVHTLICVEPEQDNSQLKHLNQHILKDINRVSSELKWIFAPDASTVSAKDKERIHRELIALQRKVLVHELFSSIQADRLRPRFQTLLSTEIMQAIIQTFTATHPGSVQMAADSKTVYFSSDSSLFSLVIEIVLDNAIDFRSETDPITIDMEINQPGFLDVTISNSGYIHPIVQLKMLNPYFSTKPDGGGLNLTLSHLIVEHYLHGQLSFYSSLSEGTQFVISIPLVPQAAQRE